MTFDPLLPKDVLEKNTRAGIWGTALATDHFDQHVIQKPEDIAVVSYRAAQQVSEKFSFADLKCLSDRVAIRLYQLGIRAGDVVAVQLPGWWHYSVLYPACVRLGAVINPLMPIFRERELQFMLSFPRTKLVIVPQEFRGFDHLAMLQKMQADLPDLAHIIAVDGTDPQSSFDEILLRDVAEEEAPSKAILSQHRADANDVTELMYTSGTTGQPKGVMHTSNTLLCKRRLATELFQLTDDDVMFMGSPLAHQTGFMYGCVLGLTNGLKLVMQDVWEAKQAATLIREEQCSFTIAATPFLSDLVYSDEVKTEDLKSMRIFMCAGAPIPRVLLRDAEKKFPNLYVMSAWGMTENGIVTATYPGDEEIKTFETDGRALPLQEVRVVDQKDQPLPANTEGRLQARGPTQFVGYYQRPEAYNTDEDRWFETGDNAYMDEDGYIRITGRSKDIIIRGGENIPVVEIEQLLYKHPAVQDAAVIGQPDPRLGERALAIIQLKDTHRLDFNEMIGFLEGLNLAKQYWPESLEIIEDFPRTPSGKIQKYKLRELYIG